MGRWRLEPGVHGFGQAHWLDIDTGLVSHYGIVAPTTWNASPRDDHGIAGPIERALEGIALADPSDPIEALRVLHSFDPCLQCAVHQPARLTRD